MGEEEYNLMLNEPAVSYISPSQMRVVDYINWEAHQESKHEYIAGAVIAMAGASLNHNRILSNLIGIVNPFLSGQPCSIFPSDLKVWVKSSETFFYPDATIICNKPEWAENYPDTVKNPAVIFEILSPSTINYDLGRKFFIYIQIDSLQEYITIDSATLQLRTARRQPDNSWKFEEFDNANGYFSIAAINLEVSIGSLYEGVRF